MAVGCCRAAGDQAAAVYQEEIQDVVRAIPAIHYANARIVGLVAEPVTGSATSPRSTA